MSEFTAIIPRVSASSGARAQSAVFLCQLRSNKKADLGVL